jgi:hypothetical protein
MRYSNTVKDIVYRFYDSKHVLGDVIGVVDSLYRMHRCIR